MEVHGFLYETLTPLTTTTTTTSPPRNSPDPDQSETYSVFRTQIPASSLALPFTSPTAAPDFFSLDVDTDETSTQPSTANPPSPPEPERALESGWFRANSRFKSPMLQLHKEIIDFCDFLSPTSEEELSRSRAVEGVFDVIKYIWPHCKVEVFGSFKTGLYLPSSDIDVVILDSRVRTPQVGLQALSKALSQRGIAKKIQVIAKARVPIVKFIERTSGVAFDISFDVENGPKAAEFIQDAVTKIPPLRPLCLILKVFLQQRELNEVYTGGIGSYALLTMLIAHLQMHWKGQYLQGHRASLEQNLGVLLVNFFEFYGRKLNIWDVGVSCQGSGAFFSKNSKGFVNKDRPFLLSIEDPQAPENDIGRNSFNYAQIRSAFWMAFSTLISTKTILGLGSNKSILGTIIRPDAVLLERKGGSNGEMTFNSLLPGAGELAPPLHGEQEILYNWQLDEEEPLPRGGDGTPGEDCSGSSRKRKKRSSREQRKSLVNNGNGEIVQNSPQEKSSRKKEKRSKRWKHHQGTYNGYDGTGSGHGNGYSWRRNQ